MGKRILVYFIVLSMMFPFHTFVYQTDANAQQSAVSQAKIGDIVSYTGNVVVRSKGKWGKLTKVPLPVFNSDLI